MAAHAHWLGVAQLMLLAVATAAAYGLLCLARPLRVCPKCKGKRHTGVGRKSRPCRRCKTRGKVYRSGAVTVHRWKWALLSERHKDRYQRQAARYQQEESDV